MITYRRDIPVDQGYAISVQKVIEHVRAHLSAIAATDDDPDTNAEDVRVEILRDDDKGVIQVIGTLDAEATAYYLAPDFDPETDQAMYTPPNALIPDYMIRRIE